MQINHKKVKKETAGVNVFFDLVAWWPFNPALRQAWMLFPSHHSGLLDRAEAQRDPEVQGLSDTCLLWRGFIAGLYHLQNGHDIYKRTNSYHIYLSTYIHPNALGTKPVWVEPTNTPMVIFCGVFCNCQFSGLPGVSQKAGHVLVN
jgi:hypothetical protein